MNWILNHQQFVFGAQAGFIFCMVALATIEKLAELTLGGARARTKEIANLEAERDRWKNRYNAQLEKGTTP